MEVDIDDEVYEGDLNKDIGKEAKVTMVTALSLEPLSVLKETA